MALVEREEAAALRVHVQDPTRSSRVRFRDQTEWAAVRRKCDCKRIRTYVIQNDGVFVEAIIISDGSNRLPCSCFVRAPSLTRRPSVRAWSSPSEGPFLRGSRRRSLRASEQRESDPLFRSSFSFSLVLTFLCPFFLRCASGYHVGRSSLYMHSSFSFLSDQLFFL